MKKLFLCSSVLALGYFPLSAAASCDDVTAQIARKIEANGVPASQFQLQAMPNAEATEASGEIVGSCENGTRKIVYTRHFDGDAGEAKDMPGVPTPEEQESMPEESGPDNQTALSERHQAQQQSTPSPRREDSQGSGQRGPNDQTTPEESNTGTREPNPQTTPEESSTSTRKPNPQTTPEESAPTPSPNDQSSANGASPQASSNGDSLRSVEERYKFLLEDADSES